MTLTKKKQALIDLAKERQEALAENYESCQSQEEVDRIVAKLKQGLTHASYQNSGRASGMGPIGLKELLWAIGRKANGA